MASILAVTCMLALAQGQEMHNVPKDESTFCPVFYSNPPSECRPVPATLLNFTPPNVVLVKSTPDLSILEAGFGAMSALQGEYFDNNYGTWPTTLDWTAVVAQTVIAGMLKSLTKSLHLLRDGTSGDQSRDENLISSYFAQIVASYFSQDVLSLRTQAYDDILWVVLGWIDTIDFVQTHSSLRYSNTSTSGDPESQGLRETLKSLPWHGFTWVSSFAHRARIFWNLGSRGWETSLCHGGMIWDRKLSPYKNAITNQLWISASVSMYQHFPGDNSTSPWITDDLFPRRDPAHLAAAVEGYKWLMNVNMTNHQGLFADGFHISHNSPGNSECDLRDEMVYTYNQGVVLTGQRGLFEVTGSPSYLEDGHRLIQSAIRSTGWDLSQNRPWDSLGHFPWTGLPRWHGLGRYGIMEEQCDASGRCSQDGQTFKGIFFHHFTAFCAPLEAVDLEPGRTINVGAYDTIAHAHATACSAYLGWVAHNAKAALQTRDDRGLFGMWWGANLFGFWAASGDDGIDHASENATDYRNYGVPEDWLRSPKSGPSSNIQDGARSKKLSKQQLLGDQASRQVVWGKPPNPDEDSRRSRRSTDLNDRGRGRTIETQIGGLALLRAYWELLQLYE